MRWQQIARNAFNYSLNQRVKRQTTNNNSNNNNIDNNNNPHHNHTSNPPSNCNKNAENFQDNFLLNPNLIDLIALNSTVNNKILKCNWIQVSGHKDSFALAGPGTIWKKHSPGSTEIDVYKELMKEPIAEMIPKFYRNVQYKGDTFIELEDLLYHFKDASIMDIKMGTRTFLETEVINNNARNDLYEKIVRIDPKQLTEEEHKIKAVTKLRYMRFRENLSSSSNLGFRIEGYKVRSIKFHFNRL